MERNKKKTVAVTVDVAVAVADTFRGSWKTDPHAIVVALAGRSSFFIDFQLNSY